MSLGVQSLAVESALTNESAAVSSGLLASTQVSSDSANRHRLLNVNGKISG